jgi:uncharacterized lipoprotein YmbA
VTPTRIARAAFGAALAAAFLAGCTLLEPRPDLSRYFVLHPAAAPGEPLPGVSLGLGPVTLAGYLRRPEILTRASAAEVRPSDVERWGEPLDDALPRVLARDLAIELGTLDVRGYPWFREAQPDVQVAVDVERFEREGDEAVVAARYEVRELRAGGRLLARATERRAPAASADAAATVDALSAALGALARELAVAVREVAAGRGPAPSGQSSRSR